MQGSERTIEASQAALETQRENRIGGIRRLLCLKGDEFCVDCGDEIGAARRAALPSAMRCITCQTAFERPRR